MSDFSLPRFDGKEAIRIIRKISPQTPIIIVTGSINEETAVECMRLGAWDYVLKDRLLMLGHSIKNTLELKEDRERILMAREELAKSVSEVYKNMPAIERSRAIVFAQNYGEAGAIEYYSKWYAVCLNIEE